MGMYFKLFKSINDVIIIVGNSVGIFILSYIYYFVFIAYIMTPD